MSTTDNKMPVTIAYDPGHVTGVCVGQYPDIWWSGEVSWHQDDMKWALDFMKHLTQWQPNIVVIESFRLYQKTAMSMVNNEFIPIQVIGSIKTNVALYNDICPDDMKIRIIMQPPSSRVNVKVLDEHKEQLLGSPHAKDAYQHFRLHAIKWQQIQKKLNK